MKRRNDAGFSLVEILVAMTILAAVVLPVCSALVMGIRMNARTDELMRAQLAVSSAVETLMAEGIPAGTQETPDGKDYGNDGTFDRFPDVTISIDEAQSAYYNVTIASIDGLVAVRTSIAAVQPQGQGGGA